MKPELQGYQRARLQPKLQMYTNGDEQVNASRAEYVAGLRVRKDAKKRLMPEPRRSALAVPADQIKLPERGKLDSVPADIEANVFIQLAHGSQDKEIPEALNRTGRIVRARVPLSRLPELARQEGISFIEMGESLKTPRPKKGRAARAPKPQERCFGDPEAHQFGQDVLIGIIDVEGFDFAHPDFLDSQGKTRFVTIWDQGGDARPSPGGKQFDYGAEFTQEHLNQAIAAAPGLGVPAHEIERQSQLTEGAHGTHVASIAAGNHGLCRAAAIAGVLIDIPDPEAEAEKRQFCFYDSTRIADAVDYLLLLAEQLKKKAVSINISLGTNGHAHDGSGAIGRYLDGRFSEAGKALTVAAGNAGQEEGEAPDDLGWVMGRIHTSGRVAAPQLVTDIEWVVAGNGRIDISENELELWFSSQDRFSVSVRTPAGDWTEEIDPLEYIENRRLKDGSFLSIYNELHHASNGSNHIAVYLSPNLKAQPVIGIAAGTWIVRLKGLEVRDGRFDGWIERDDPRPFDAGDDRELWSFPSYFSKKSMMDNSTVSSLGCGNRVITVANLDETRNRIHITSSQGPSRDGRTKPDIAAPGTDIVAAKAFFRDGNPWIAMTGTSMASPYVTGVAGLMLAVEPRLTAAQIEGIMRGTARPLPGSTFAWVNDAGYGVIDPNACLKQAALLNQRKDCTKGKGA